MYRKIYALFGISIFSVVLTHGITYGLWALYAWTDRYQNLLPPNYNPLITPQWFGFLFVKEFIIFCLPAFFFISGFIFTFGIDKASGNVKWSIVRARIVGLLIPYLIWETVGMVMNIFQGTLTTPTDYLLFLFGLNGGYWFTPVLIFFFIISRWLIPLARDHWQKLLVGAAIFQLVSIILRYTAFVHLSSPLLYSIFFIQFDILPFTYLFFFTLGTTFSLHLTEFSVWVQKNVRYFIILGIIFFSIIFSIASFTDTIIRFTNDWKQFIYQIAAGAYALMVILSFLALKDVNGKLFKLFSQLSSYTYGIYLTHILFMILFSKLVYHFFPALLSWQIVFAILTIIVGLGGSLLLMTIVKRSPLRTMYRYLFG